MFSGVFLVNRYIELSIRKGTVSLLDGSLAANRDSVGSLQSQSKIPEPSQLLPRAVCPASRKALSGDASGRSALNSLQKGTSNAVVISATELGKCLVEAVCNISKITLKADNYEGAQAKTTRSQ